ncbi:MAG: recombination protein RecO [Epsilonproteobacteria bacterium]|nr:recombination protein RecO [Campylobacterota bacterium]NPA64530.1 recombination protein RecO [Campylobacterota bacterium]
MQGFILNITRAKNEDLIVSILTQRRLHTLYRFYGARHSTINIGYKIDFDIEYQIGYLPKLRHITHLGYSWLRDLDKALAWQRFITLLYRHLQEIEEPGEFYFDLLERLAQKLTKQHPKRAIIESYVDLLGHEGRLHHTLSCFVCEENIDDDPVLVRSFLPAHPGCIPKEPFERAKIEHLFRYKDAQFFDDREIELLWNILTEGI